MEQVSTRSSSMLLVLLSGYQYSQDLSSISLHYLWNKCANLSFFLGREGKGNLRACIIFDQTDAARQEYCVDERMIKGQSTFLQSL